MKNLYISLSLSMLFVWGFSIGVRKVVSKEEHAKVESVLSSVEAERLVSSVGGEGVSSVSLSPTELSEEELNIISEEFVARFNMLPKEQKKVLLLKFRQTKRKINTAYILSFFGLHPFYINASKGATITLFLECLILLFLWSYFVTNSFDEDNNVDEWERIKNFLSVIGSVGALTMLSWIVHWKNLSSNLKKTNKEIFEKLIISIGY